MSKPASQPRWATDGGALITTPSSGAQDVGHVPSTALTAQLANWFWNLVYQWTLWLAGQVSGLITNLGAVVDDGGDNTLANMFRMRAALTAICGASSATVNGGGESFEAFASAGAGRIVAVGDSGGMIKTSDDCGVTWTSRTAGSAFAGSFNDVLWASGLGLYIAVGVGTVQTSPDGVTWTQRVTSALNYGSVAFDGVANVVVVAWDGASTYSTLTSANGTSYTSHAQAISLSTTALVFGLGLFVAGKNAAGVNVYTSPDGVTWTARVWGSSSAMLCNHLAYCTNTGHLYAHGATGGTRELQTSTDGITWARIRSGTGVANALLATDFAVFAMDDHTVGRADWVGFNGSSPSTGLDFQAPKTWFGYRSMKVCKPMQRMSVLFSNTHTPPDGVVNRSAVFLS